MTIDELNPFIRYGAIHTFYHKHKENSVCYDCRLFYVSLGEGQFVANGKTYTISNNSLIYLPPETHYNFNFKDNFSVKIFVLNFDLIDDFHDLIKSFSTAFESTFIKDHKAKYIPSKEFSQVVVQQNRNQVLNRIIRCVETFQSKDLYYMQTASALLKLVLIDILKENENQKGDYELAQSIIEYIREHYNEFDLSNQTIADQFNYHPYHLNRLFKSYTKTTLHDFLLNYRLQMAKNYLTTTLQNITAIAEKTGFSSYTYFIKLFRERVGVSPLKYRKNNKSLGF